MSLMDDIKTFTEVFMNMKKGICEKDKGPSELIPMMNFKFDKQEGYCGVLMPDGNPVDHIVEIWGAMATNDSLGKMQTAIIMTEAYAAKDMNHVGKMADEFKNNPNSDIVEIINVHGIDLKTGQQVTGFVGFKYDDRGQPVFDEPVFGICEGPALESKVPALFASCRDANIKYENFRNRKMTRIPSLEPGLN